MLPLSNEQMRQYSVLQQGYAVMGRSSCMLDSFNSSVGDIVNTSTSDSDKGSDSDTEKKENSGLTSPVINGKLFGFKFD